jgi:hypothetical protein
MRKKHMERSKWRSIFIFSLVVGGGFSLLSSSSPDGLEKVAETQGFLEKGKQLFSGIIPDYQMPWIHSSSLATSFAGIAGVCIVFGVLFLIGKALYHFEGE